MVLFIYFLSHRDAFIDWYVEQLMVQTIRDVKDIKDFINATKVPL